MNQVLSKSKYKGKWGKKSTKTMLIIVNILITPKQRILKSLLFLQPHLDLNAKILFLSQHCWVYFPCIIPFSLFILDLFLLQNKYHAGNKVQCFFIPEIVVFKEQKKTFLICGKVSTAERLTNLFP